MSITKTKWDRDFGDTYEVECDGCGEVEEIDGDFDDCLRFLKDEGWKTTKESGDWEHFCPDCKDKD